MRRLCSLWMVTLAVATLAFAALPGLAEDAPATEPKPLEMTLERMAEILYRLDEALGEVERPAARRLEAGVEEAAGLVEKLLGVLEEEAQTSAPRKGAVELGLTLHRLVVLLEDTVGGPGRRLEQAKARQPLEELRAWVNGYTAALTAGMRPREAERLDRVAHQLARALLGQVARMAKESAPEANPSKLPGVVAHLEALTQRLDALLQRWAERQQSAPAP